MANRITTVVEYAVSDAIKSLQDTQKELGKTEISGKDLADALRKAADSAETEIKSISAASAAMEQALGADFVAARAQAGVSVDDIVMELSHLGVSFDDIKTDADQLADAVKRLDDVRTPIRGVGEEAQTTATKLDAVRSSGDQSRSVLANMVGNSTQELGELGGIAGTVGMALGQLGEYATEGNIKLANLAAIAGPMAALAAAGMGLSAVMKAQAEQAADLRRETELLVDVERARREGRQEEVIEKLAEEYRDTLPILKEYGMGVAEIDAVLDGNTETIDVLKATLKSYDQQLLDTKDMTIDEIYTLDNKRDALNEVIATLEEADTAQGSAKEQIEATDASIKAWTEYITNKTKPALFENKDALGSFVDTINDSIAANAAAKQATLDYGEALDKSREAAKKRLETERELYGFMLSQVDAQRAYEVAVDSGEDAVRSFDEVLGSNKATLEEIDDAARTSSDSLISQAEAFAASKGAADGSKESIRLQAEELFRLAMAMDPKSPLRARLVEYINELQSIPKSVDTMLNLRISSGAVTTKDGDAIGQRDGARAKGGPVSAGGAYLVGEEGPELLQMGSSSGSIIPNHALSGHGTTIILNGYISEAMLDELEQAMDRRDRGRR
jgi:hypothetical protein